MRESDSPAHVAGARNSNAKAFRAREANEVSRAERKEKKP